MAKQVRICSTKIVAILRLHDLQYISDFVYTIVSVTEYTT